MGRCLKHFTVFCGLAFSLSLAVAGCGGDTDELPRQPVSGTVTLDGQPLAVGIIQFRPASAQEPVTAGAEIKEGRFTIPRDQGLTPGNYRVFINSSGEKKGPTQAESAGEKLPGIMPDLIPARYNSESTLTAKVEADKPNAYEFALKK